MASTRIEEVMKWIDGYLMVKKIEREISIKEIDNILRYIKGIVYKSKGAKHWACFEWEEVRLFIIKYTTDPKYKGLRIQQSFHGI